MGEIFVLFAFRPLETTIDPIDGIHASWGVHTLRLEAHNIDEHRLSSVLVVFVSTIRRVLNSLVAIR